MDFVTMQNAVLERFAEKDRANAKLWLNIMGAQIWSAENWSFKYREDDITVTQGASATSGFPGDLGHVIDVFNDSGDTLTFLPFQKFNRTFRTMIQQAQLGEPTCWTVSGNQSRDIRLGPPSSRDATFPIVYKAKWTDMTADAEISDIPVEFHWLQVAGAMAIGQSHQQDPTAALQDPIIQRGIEAMKGEWLTGTSGQPSAWGEIFGTWTPS